MGPCAVAAGAGKNLGAQPRRLLVGREGVARGELAAWAYQIPSQTFADFLPIAKS